VGVPIASGINDRFEVVPWRPPDGLFGQRIVSYQHRRVARATWTVLNVETSADDVLNRLQQLLDGGSLARSEIHGTACAIIQEMLDRTRVSIGKIKDVDEVAHAGAVACVIVAPQHFKIRPPPQSRFNRDRNGVSFGRMPFPNSSQGIGSCSVEIAQNHASNA